MKEIQPIELFEDCREKEKCDERVRRASEREFAVCHESVALS